MTTLTPLRYTEAKETAQAALFPYIGTEIADGWVLNGGTARKNSAGACLYNLNISSTQKLSAEDEAELFYPDGIDATVDFLEKLDILGVAVWRFNQDEQAE